MTLVISWANNFPDGKILDIVLRERPKTNYGNR